MTEWYDRLLNFMPTHVKGAPQGWIDVSQPSLWFAVASILFNPTFWNVVAQNEYRRKTMTRMLGGNRYLGCYILAATIFSLGLFRDHLYQEALKAQPVHTALLHPFVRVVAGVLFVAGSVFVLTSMWALGITGTYLGDYFGILMDAMVTGFPFNVLNNPMYVGSTLNFIAVALWMARPAGLFLSVLVWIVYKIALQYEEPFTANIYKEAAAKKGAQKDQPAPSVSMATLKPSVTTKTVPPSMDSVDVTPSSQPQPTHAPAKAKKSSASTASTTTARRAYNTRSQARKQI